MKLKIILLILTSAIMPLASGLAGNDFITNTSVPVGGKTAAGVLKPILVDADGTVHTTGAGGGGGASTIADGADVAQGTTTDAAVAAGAAGTTEAKLRRLTTDIDAIKTSAASNTTNTGNIATHQTDGTQTTQVTKQVGAANYSNGQVATSTTAGTLKASTATRRSITVINMDASITVYIGAATVTAANGFPLKAGQSISLDTTGLIQVIAASGTPTVAYFETSD